MNTKQPAPALMSSAEAERVVAERTSELAAIKADIASKQAALSKLAMDPDDAKFEEASLAIERQQRAELRAKKRLEAAQEALAEAKGREKQARFRALYGAGQKAAAEAEKLAGDYAKHAAAIADIFCAIDKLNAPVEAANAALPDGEQRIDADHALAIHLWTELPAAVSGREHFWWRGPLNATPEPVFIPRIVTFEPSTPRAEKQAGPQLLGESGARGYTLPACDWPSKPEAEVAR
jgi:hypothetical protein